MPPCFRWDSLPKVQAAFRGCIVWRVVAVGCRCVQSSLHFFGVGRVVVLRGEPNLPNQQHGKQQRRQRNHACVFFGRLRCAGRGFGWRNHHIGRGRTVVCHRISRASHALLGNPQIVFGAFFGVGQHFIRLIDKLHNAVRVRVGVQIGVVLLGQSAIGLANFGFAGIGRKVQIVVVGANRHKSNQKIKGFGCLRCSSNAPILGNDDG